ncbi:MAG: metal-dependent hydrolase [Gammaproteobacteria bacterium RBG_16_57_12]|nr:MAG: metal-dependent hydrolase [Gammaproteobacteria bacterium RBG_16_57_12]
MRANTIGFYTLFTKEVWRFLKVITQTILTPAVTTLLYLVVFAQILEGRVEVYEGISYAAFLVPGLVIMAMIQNAFANSSSSLIQSKMNGNLVFVLLAPISVWEFYLAFVLATVVRGLLVGAVVYVAALWFVTLPIHHPALVLLFAVVGSAILGALGVIAGIWASKYDQLAAFQNFIVLPLSFLSGVFYSVHTLPPFWQQATFWNPFFYMIDGFRHGVIGVSDVDPWKSLLVCLLFLAVVSAVCLVMLKKGYKIRG